MMQSPYFSCQSLFFLFSGFALHLSSHCRTRWVCNSGAQSAHSHIRSSQIEDSWKFACLCKVILRSVKTCFCHDGRAWSVVQMRAQTAPHHIAIRLITNQALTNAKMIRSSCSCELSILPYFTKPQISTRYARPHSTACLPFPIIELTAVGDTTRSRLLALDWHAHNEDCA